MSDSRKRKNVAVTTDGAPYNKRSRPSLSGQDDVKSTPRAPAARIDPSTGLRCAFPGLEEEQDGQLFYGPASDGMEYLRMVRSEAKGVPRLLVAPRDVNGIASARDANSVAEAPGGYYFDGAYTSSNAPARTSPDENSKGRKDINSQDAYRESLLLRFRLLRATLRCSPPLEVVTALDKDHPIQLANTKEAWRRWRYLLHNTDPSPAQIAMMSQQTAARALRTLTSRFIRKQKNITARTARWTWALLGKLEDVGCLHADAISDVRNVGKNATWVLRSLRNDREAATDEKEDEPTIADPDELEGDWLEDNEGHEAQQDADSQVERFHDSQSQTGDDDHSAVIQQKADGQMHQRPNGIEEPPEAVSAPHKPLGGQTYSDSLTTTEASSPSPASALLATPAPLLTQYPVPSPATALAEAKANLLSALTNTKPSSPTGDLEPINDDPIEENIAKSEADPDPVPSANTLATLDMIITIVGEVFGQRDLLEYRDSWE
ncbi:MAG: hypothetical protein M1833_005822 [Piccolia ochrophora]|nr:MAG: hypothetical protein M1833_005822 [Piccolia ochrophora]